MLEFPKVDQLVAISLREMGIIIFLRYFFDILAGILYQSIGNLT